MDIEATANDNCISPQALAFINDYYMRSEMMLETKLVRPTFEYVNKSDRFKLKHSTKGSLQNSSLYFSRLAKLQESIRKRLKSGSNKPIELIDLKNNTKVAVIGTILKEMQFKPSVLTKLNVESTMGPNKFKSFAPESDAIYIEDSKARAKLVFNERSIFRSSELSANEKFVTPENLITGMVVGILGFTDEKGNILVEEIVLDDFLPQMNKEPYDWFIKQAKLLQFTEFSTIRNLQSIEKYVISTSPDDRFIGLISGLNLKPEGSQSAFQLLKSFLAGGIASSPLEKLGARVSRMIFAGNLIAEQQDLLMVLQGAFKMQEMFTQLQQELGKALKCLDSLLLEIAQQLPVDIMPGSQDPSDARLPQQPLNQSYFPNAYQSGNLNAVSNPYEFELDGVTILGTAGENVSDIMQYSKISSDVIEVMNSNVLWRHIAPTATDALKCYSYSEDDPFVLSELPHIYFTGNQESFGTKLIVDEKEHKICRLISVPIFSKSHSIVLVNLKNLDAFEVCFSQNEDE